MAAAPPLIDVPWVFEVVDAAALALVFCPATVVVVAVLARAVAPMPMATAATVPAALMATVAVIRRKRR